MQFYEKILKIIFPEACGICGTLGEYICPNCYQKIKKYYINNKYNKNKSEFYLLKYENEIRKLLIDYKFNDKSYLYKTFSKLIIKNKNALDFIKKYDIIIPVPLHKKRLNERGYNQSELVIKNITKELKIQEKLKTNILIKKRHTDPQSTKKGKERKNNVKGAYIIKNEEDIVNKKILIFDDIVTTGNTYKECKKIIERYDIKEVGLFTIAKDYIK